MRCAAMRCDAVLRCFCRNMNTSVKSIHLDHGQMDMCGDRLLTQAHDAMEAAQVCMLLLACLWAWSKLPSEMFAPNPAECKGAVRDKTSSLCSFRLSIQSDTFIKCIAQFSFCIRSMTVQVVEVSLAESIAESMVGIP